MITKWVPWIVLLVLVGQIFLLGRLSVLNESQSAENGRMRGLFGRYFNRQSCEEWLEKYDNINFTRDFSLDPIVVLSDTEEDWSTCDVGCWFRNGYFVENTSFERDIKSKKEDATFAMAVNSDTIGILKSMESSHYYAGNNIDAARREGYKIVMTTSLSSDIPVGYFSWAEYDIMATVQPKYEKAEAAAFISNCGSTNFRLQALEQLQRHNVKVDSYGACLHNREENEDKVETLKRYKFSLAFENSCEEDYVTEKFWQSLVAGAVPVVIGAPNIQDFQPSSNSILQIKSVEQVGSVAETMKYLSSNFTAYNEMLQWKFEGPSDSFKALVDMAVVHSSCRLCIHLATQIHTNEEILQNASEPRPCKCKRGSETVYHLYVRERGRFVMESIFIRSGSLTLKGLEISVLSKFRKVSHVPIWKTERPKVLQGGDELKIYRIYPVGLTQRQALYTRKFQNDDEVRQYVEGNPCAKLEVIFV